MHNRRELKYPPENGFPGFRWVSADEAYALSQLVGAEIFGTYGDTLVAPEPLYLVWCDTLGKARANWSNDIEGNFCYYWVRADA